MSITRVIRTPTPNVATVIEVAAPPSPVDTERQGDWFVLHTKARQEKAVARALRAAEIEHFLPLNQRVTYHGHRKRTVTVPVLPSYVFLRGDDKAAYLAVSTRRVANVIRVADQRRLSDELRQLRLAIAGGALLAPDRFLEVGRLVRVTHGPFRGLEGLVEHRIGTGRLVLQITALGRATSLEIDADLLESAD